MQYRTSKEALVHLPVQMVVIGFFDREQTPPRPVLSKEDQGEALDKALGGTLSALLKERELSGKEGESLLITPQGKIKADYLLLLGCGPKKQFSLETLRKLGGRITQTANELKISSVAFVLEKEKLGGFSPLQRMEALMEGMELAVYSFEHYKKEEDRTKKTFSEGVLVSPLPVEAVRKIASKVTAMVQGVSLARELVNAPSNEVTPSRLAAEAKKIASKYKLLCDIFNLKKMESERMGALLAVAKGSKELPAFIHLTYKPKGKIKTKVALVGKGITFDSGGLNIKLRDMEAMKSDMAGAAAVLGVFETLPQLKLPVQVEGFIAAAENMPSGSAVKPSDIIRARNGKTIEIFNTDAEGRLVLADALSYASDRKPHYMIDIATLTGGAAYALGEKIVPILGNNDKMIRRFLECSKQTGELCWQLPLFQEYKKGYKRGPADLKNSGSGTKASTIAGALFLEEFVAPGIPWMHMDIASACWSEEPPPYLSRWATGVPVRTLLNFLASF